MSKALVASAFADPSRQGADMASTPMGGAQIQAQYRFRVTGQIVTANEQASFFNKVTDPAIDATYTALVPVVAGGFTLVEVADFLFRDPAPPVNMNIPFSSVASLIPSQTLWIIRKQPDRLFGSKQLDLAGYQTPQDQQATRVQVELPGDVPFDGYSYIRITQPSINPAAVYDPIFSFGARVDARRDVQSAAPVLIRSA